MISFTTSGSTAKTSAFLQKMQANNLYSDLEGYAQRGVAALQAATPVDTGLAAASWYYTIENNAGGVAISWRNNDIEGGVNVVILLQYGHGTGTGGYVAGRDYINGALQPIFDEIANGVWEKVTTA